MLVKNDNEENVGFAGGCNIGIRYALQDSECSHVWLLNNDTVVDPYALEEMINKCQLNSNISICGSQVRYYQHPDKIQTFGGKLNQLFCTTHTLYGEHKCEEITAEPQNIDFVPGASMHLLTHKSELSL